MILITGLILECYVLKFNALGGNMTMKENQFVLCNKLVESYKV
jgi:hypothetical protein